jgi:hypothetical protein
MLMNTHCTSMPQEVQQEATEETQCKQNPHLLAATQPPHALLAEQNVQLICTAIRCSACACVSANSKPSVFKSLELALIYLLEAHTQGGKCLQLFHVLNGCSNMHLRSGLR